MRLNTFFRIIKSQGLFFALVALWLLGWACLLLLYDKTTSHFMASGNHNLFFDYFFKYITHMGDGLAALVVVLFFVMVNMRKAVAFLVGVYSAGLATQLLKRFVFNDHLRPAKFIGKDQLILVDGVDVHELFSFPSGHTTAAFAMAYMLVFLFPGKKNQLLFFLLAALVAYSRIYLSQHFIEDVAAGTCVGILVPMLIMLLFFPKISRLSNFPIGSETTSKPE